MKQHIPLFRIRAEVLIAVVAGCIVAGISSWWDPDTVIDSYWFPVLLVVGLLFGLFGCCPVLAIGPIFAWTGILAELLDISRYGFHADILGFYSLFFAIMAGLVIVGAAIGRGGKRYWIKKRMKPAAI